MSLLGSPRTEKGSAPEGDLMEFDSDPKICTPSAFRSLVPAIGEKGKGNVIKLDSGPSWVSKKQLRYENMTGSNDARLRIKVNSSSHRLSEPHAPTSPSNHLDMPSKQSVIPAEIEDGRQLTRNEVLERAREEQLKKISLRNRARDKDATTSLSDLGLARKKPRTQRKSRLEDTVWPNDVLTSNHATLSSGLNIDNTKTRQNQVLPPASGKMDASKDNNYATSPLGIVQNRAAGIGSHIFHGGSRPSAIAYSGELGQRPHQMQHKPQNDTRWASKVELQPIKVNMEVSSNAWGSSIPEDASQASDDSVQPLHFGRLFRNREPDLGENPLTGWDGKLQPPPVDWNDRPRFNNNNPEFRDAFARWAKDVSSMTCGDTDLSFAPIPPHIINDLQWHPDGLTMVARTMTINEKNATRYGYEQDLDDVVKYSQHLSLEDFDDWGKLDLSKQENLANKDETTHDLVTTWIANTEDRRQLAQIQLETQKKARAAVQEYKAIPNPNRPIVNIYLRPAQRIDMQQMLDIYNWYIEYSARPAEMVNIPAQEMYDRIENCKSNKLPVIVALMKNRNSARRHDNSADVAAWESAAHPIKNIDPATRTMEYDEKVVGWASASDFTAYDFVERISVEAEVYVDPEYRQKGIGRCLMDKLLEALDRGYVKKGGYPFHCAQEIRHLYSPGGGRDIHKIMMILRKWKHPKDHNGRLIRASGGSIARNVKVDDCENDYDAWLKDWLETWGFQVEGLLSGIGAKNGRFIDAVYLGRETMWQPEDGRIPDPLPGTY